MEDADKQKQVEIAENLQLKVLQRFDTLLDEGTITSTDMATLVRLLASNGWVLDPARLPQRLKSKLLDEMRFDDDMDAATERRLKVI